jgi:hypothetical protein
MTALFFQDVVKRPNDRVKHKVLLIIDSPSCHVIGDKVYNNVELLILPPGEFFYDFSYVKIIG